MALNIEENGKTKNITMTKESGEDSLWINTPNGMMHLYIGHEGMMDITVWNRTGGRTENRPAGMTKKQHPTSRSIYHIKQV